MLVLILALDSSRKQQSITLFDGDNKLASFAQENKSSQLMPALVKLFEEAKREPQQLDLLACSIGPGSFTGLRTALTIIKTMAAQLKLPVFAINNFELLRFQNRLAADQALIMNAGKNDYFVSLNSDYQNPETNFFSLEDQGMSPLKFSENSAESIIQYMQANPDYTTIKYQELEPYYLREPSINQNLTTRLPRQAAPSSQ